MNGSKSLLASKTFWGALVALLAALASLFGFSFSEADQAQVVDLMDQALASVDRLIIVGGSMLAIYGRLTAKKRIG